MFLLGLLRLYGWHFAVLKSFMGAAIFYYSNYLWVKFLYATVVPVVECGYCGPVELFLLNFWDNSHCK